MMNDSGNGDPGELAPAGHAITPVAGSAVKTKQGFSGAPANLMDRTHYPVEAICAECGGIVRAERMYLCEWEHTGRRPGDPR
jgi:hypothetical protein